MDPATAVNASDSQQDRFQTLLDRHRGIVLKVAGTYCRLPEDRADLAQEIRAQLWRAFPGYDETRTFSTWMYRIALNVAISFARGHGERERRASSLDDAEDVLVHDAEPARETDDGIRVLYRCIDGLGALDRALLLLYLDERSQREIADVLGIGESNVATKIARLKQRIRNDMHPEGL
jgi:RNA polymerase sigma-70 factor (ECF subfamily)